MVWIFGCMIIALYKWLAYSVGCVVKLTGIIMTQWRLWCLSTSFLSCLFISVRCLYMSYLI